MTIEQRILLSDIMIDASDDTDENKTARKAEARRWIDGSAFAREIALGVAADVEDPEDDDDPFAGLTLGGESASIQ